MTCAICNRQAKGFGWHDPKTRSGRKVFCSMRCQTAFSRIMDKTEGSMVDPSELEIAAMQACLGPLGDFVAAIGMDRPLAAYRKEDVLGLVETIVSAYQEHMIAEHERAAARDQAFLEARLARTPRSVRTPGVPF